MRKSRQCFLLALITLAMSGGSSAMDHEPVSVPFTVEGGHLIVIKGRIGHLQDLNLVLDTGASSVVISRRVARELSLKGKSKEIEAYGMKARVQEVRLPSIDIASLHFENVSAVVSRLEMAGRGQSFRMDALIGLNLLKQLSLSIDYMARQVLFGPIAHSSSSLSFYGKLSVIVIPMTIRGERVSLMLDTGAERLIFFRRKADGKVPMKRTGEQQEIRHVGGKARLLGVRLSEVQMSETRWEELPAYLLDASSPDKYLDGILGIASLGLTKLNLDLTNNLISWER